VKLSIAIVLISGLLMPMQAAAESYPCTPTPPDSLGPFYKPDAPVRSEVGQGYELSGVVRSAVDCAPIPDAKIEFWLAGPDGDYDDQHRATVYADAAGEYRFRSNPPPRYFSRPPHIHLRVSAKGFQTLVSQHYPEDGASGAALDLVLLPAESATTRKTDGFLVFGASTSALPAGGTALSR